MPSDERQVALLALRTRAIDAANELIEVSRLMEQHFAREDTNRWLAWAILPGDLMDTASEPEPTRIAGSNRIESAMGFRVS